MDLTTELLDNAAFREAKRGGYNTQDVDEFIEQVKSDYLRHSALLVEAKERVEAAEVLLADAEERAAEAIANPGGPSEAEETLKRTLVLAQRTADAAIKEADEQAARTLAAAQEQAARMLSDAQESSARARAEAESEARRAQEEARTRVLGELRDLEAARDQLHADVDTLERHLEEQRDRVRFSTLELQRLLDDPAGLRQVSVPAVTNVAVPDGPDANDVESARAVDEPTGSWEPDDDWPAPVRGTAGRERPVEDEPITTIDLAPSHDGEDDAYLAELRKAMSDDAPLGPREEGDFDLPFHAEHAQLDENRSRFGRRR